MSLKYKILYPFVAELYEDILLDNIKAMIKREEYHNLNKLIIQDLYKNMYYNVNINYDKNKKALINVYPVKNINNIIPILPPNILSPLPPTLISPQIPVLPILPSIVPSKKYLPLLPPLLPVQYIL